MSNLPGNPHHNVAESVKREYGLTADKEALNEMAKELENQLAWITRETGQTRSGRGIIRRIRTRANQYKEAPSA